jgi:hypothetical protein
MEKGKSNRRDELLASFGADRSRGPEAERSAFPDHGGAGEEEARAIDRVLALASEPRLPADAMARLMSRLDEERPAEIIQFRPRPRPSRQPFFRFASVPLAASLILGIYLGAQGTLDFALPTSLTGTVAQADDVPDDLGGVGEADAYAEENFT